MGYNVIKHSHKQNYSHASCGNLDGTEEWSAEWNKSEARGQILDDVTHLQYREKQNQGHGQ